MISISEFLLALGFALVYLLIIPFQMLVFPMNYFSIRDAIYSYSMKKAVKASASRALVIFLLCLIQWIIDKNGNAVIWGAGIGSFLCAWPSIYQYHLLDIKSNSKMLYFVSCLASVLFSYICASLEMKLLLPIMFQGKTFYFLDNNGFHLFISIIGLCAPVGIRKIINKEGPENPYIDSDTFIADLILTKRKIKFESKFEEDYIYEIIKSSEKYAIGEDLLITILQLERINRNSWYYRACEYIGVRFLKKLLIKRNATLGLGQVDILTAKHYFRMSPLAYIAEMIKPTIAIDLCAYKIRTILDRYNSEFDEEYFDQYQDVLPSMSENDKISIYLSSEYICGDKLSLRKFVLVYAMIIKEANPSGSLISEIE